MEWRLDVLWKTPCARHALTLYRTVQRNHSSALVEWVEGMQSHIEELVQSDKDSDTHVQWVDVLAEALALVDDFGVRGGLRDAGALKSQANTTAHLHIPFEDQTLDDKLSTVLFALQPQGQSPASKRTDTHRQPSSAQGANVIDVRVGTSSGRVHDSQTGTEVRLVGKAQSNEGAQQTLPHVQLGQGPTGYLSPSVPVLSHLLQPRHFHLTLFVLCLAVSEGRISRPVRLLLCQHGSSHHDLQHLILALLINRVVTVEELLSEIISMFNEAERALKHGDSAVQSVNTERQRLCAEVLRGLFALAPTVIPYARTVLIQASTLVDIVVESLLNSKDSDSDLIAFIPSLATDAPLLSLFRTFMQQPKHQGLFRQQLLRFFDQTLDHPLFASPLFNHSGLLRTLCVLYNASFFKPTDVEATHLHKMIVATSHLVIDHKIQDATVIDLCTCVCLVSGLATSPSPHQQQLGVNALSLLIQTRTTTSASAVVETSSWSTHQPDDYEHEPHNAKKPKTHQQTLAAVASPKHATSSQPPSGPPSRVASSALQSGQSMASSTTPLPSSWQTVSIAQCRSPNLLLLVVYYVMQHEVAVAARLVSSTLLNVVQVPPTNLSLYSVFAAKKAFSQRVLAIASVESSPTVYLHAGISGVLPLHCVHSALKNRAFIKYMINPLPWIHQQLLQLAPPPNQIPDLLCEVLQMCACLAVEPLGTPEAGFPQPPPLNQQSEFDHAHPLPLLSSEALKECLAHASLSLRALATMYILLFHDTLEKRQSRKGSPHYPYKHVTPAPPPIDKDVMALIDYEALSKQIHTHRRVLGAAFPVLSALISSAQPHLVITRTQVQEQLTTFTSSILGQETTTLAKTSAHTLEAQLTFLLALAPKTYSDLIVRGLSRILPCLLSPDVSEYACMLAHRVVRKYSATYRDRLWPIIASCWDASIPIPTDLPNAKTWVDPLAEAPHITYAMLVQNPLLLLQCHPEVFQRAHLLTLLLEIVESLVVASRCNIHEQQLAGSTTIESSAPEMGNGGAESATHGSVGAVGSTGEAAETTVAELGHLARVLAVKTECVIIHVLLENCTANPDVDRSVVGRFIHSRVLEDPGLLGVLVAQGLTSSQLELIANHVPSVHSLAVIVPSMLQSASCTEQARAIGACATVATIHPSELFLAACRQCLGCIGTMFEACDLDVHKHIQGQGKGSWNTPRRQYEQLDALIYSLSHVVKIFKTFPSTLSGCITVASKLSQLIALFGQSHPSLHKVLKAICAGLGTSTLAVQLR
eukprot:m.29117 g.29117  ORF g.29117 m.29117 type:complete len:1266 (-) comp9123_c0_seq1:303-4100(-)